jgi:dTDP-4-dehydrorhamnose 3,5-epimerase
MPDPITQSSIIPGIFFIERPTFDDDRGFFREYFRLNELATAVGRPINLVQANHSRSVQRVLRGVHVATYDKLIYIVNGTVQMALVDLRPNSSTFREVEFFEVGEKNRRTVFIPAGIGNSFYATSPSVDYIYFVGDYYNPANEQTIRWDDPDLNIPWTDRQPIVSKRDSEGAKSFAEIFSSITIPK